MRVNQSKSSSFKEHKHKYYIKNSGNGLKVVKTTLMNDLYGGASTKLEIMSQNIHSSITTIVSPDI